MNFKMHYNNVFTYFYIFIIYTSHSSKIYLKFLSTHKTIKVKAKEIRKEIGEGIEIILPRITKCVLYIVIGNPMVA